jgi:murein DD-endopeptidase MepM/ murein hydrolase activator NlpD
VSSRDNELGASSPNALPSRRSLRQTAPQADASDAVLSELQRQVSEVKATPGAGTGELRRDRNRLRGASTAAGTPTVDPAVQAWVDRSPLQSVETTTTGSISLPPVVLPPVIPPAVTENAPVLAPATGQLPVVTVREMGQARGRKPSTGISRPKKAVRRHGFAARMFSLTAMVFVGLMAVATSIPANALLTPEQVAQMAMESQYGLLDDVDGQSIIASGSDATIGRDGVSVTNGFQLSMRRTELSYTNNPNANIQWPFHITVPIADGYGYRVAPCDGCSSDHKGVDFDPGQGAPIMAIADGTVIQTVESWGGLGYYVVVAHNINGESFESWYGHMYQGSIAVSVGQNVKLGEILGLVGDTGMSTGAHLHLEIHMNGEPVDPFAFITERNR